VLDQQNVTLIAILPFVQAKPTTPCVAYSSSCTFSCATLIWHGRSFKTNSFLIINFLYNKLTTSIYSSHCTKKSNNQHLNERQNQANIDENDKHYNNVILYKIQRTTCNYRKHNRHC